MSQKKRLFFLKEDNIVSENKNYNITHKNWYVGL